MGKWNDALKQVDEHEQYKLATDFDWCDHRICSWNTLLQTKLVLIN